jgi:hypothetical protein
MRQGKRGKKQWQEDQTIYNDNNNNSQKELKTHNKAEKKEKLLKIYISDAYSII